MDAGRDSPTFDDRVCANSIPLVVVGRPCFRAAVFVLDQRSVYEMGTVSRAQDPSREGQQNPVRG
jgi:hypothetical protein